jgi:hypothetical protein
MGAAGNALIVTDAVLLQPEALVNVKVTLPADTPVTKPPLVTVATEGLLLVQLPPVVGFSVMVELTHKLDWGALTMGNALIVTVTNVRDAHSTFVELFLDAA